MAIEEGMTTGSEPPQDEPPQDEPPQEVWGRWAAAHQSLLSRATDPQRILLEAAVRCIAGVSAPATLVRLIAFFLLHADMGLTPVQVGAAVGRTDRAMRTVQALSARDLLDALWAELRRHRQPKLHPEHAGPIAQFLVEHPRATQAEVVTWIARTLAIQVDVQTLARFFKVYGLGVLFERHGAQELASKRPFASAPPITEAPSSCSPSRSS
jgi:hypothetical protein